LRKNCAAFEPPDFRRFGRTGKKLKARPERRFYFDLALKLGMTVGEMLQKMDSAEVTEWLAYFQVQQPEKPKTSDALRAMFGGRVKKKEQ